jgi:hypothetical protein
MGLQAEPESGGSKRNKWVRTMHTKGVCVIMTQTIPSSRVRSLGGRAIEEDTDTPSPCRLMLGPRMGIGILPNSEATSVSMTSDLTYLRVG